MVAGEIEKECEKVMRIKKTVEAKENNKTDRILKPDSIRDKCEVPEGHNRRVCYNRHTLHH